MLISLSFVISTVCFANVEGETVCKQRHCLIIVDAGSSGTRAHTYAYDLDEGENPIHIDELYSQKITPGFASIEPKQKQVSAYLKRLMSNSPIENLPVYFYATAGMRLLPMEQQQHLYRLLKHWFLTKSQWTLLEAKTITGSEEGVFGWLATSYQLGLLDLTNQTQVGFIEIGGASTQVAFPVQQFDAVNEQDVTSIDVYNHQILLFSHSFLGLGVNEITKKFETTPACFPTGYILPNNAIAQGDADLCQKIISESIIQSYTINDIVKTVKANNPPTIWYTAGAASLLIKNLPNSFQIEQFTAENLLQKVNETYCQSDWQEQQQKQKDEPYLFQNCILGAYYYGLATNGYGIEPSETIHIMPPNLKNDWTLGVILHQQNLNHFH